MSRYHYDYTHRTRHSMRKVYLGLVSQSIGKRILIQSQYVYSETKVSKKRTCATQDMNSHSLNVDREL